MTTFDINEVTSILETTHVSPNGISFAGKSLKLDTENDAKPVVDALDKCTQLEYLNLEGNTLGVNAAEVIAKALERHPEFKRALWKDMFTGRMKTEIPKALQFLGNGLVTAGARLTELDLSDNAFGPIGVEGLASLLRSSSCYALEELRLNNNGLGIGGGKLLANALLDCYNFSKKEGKPLSLKVFIAGRNRLENDGAKALAEVFKTIGTLEEIVMPQNGIYYVGITALSEAFKHNANLQILNLNDNTIGLKGSKAIAKVLPDLTNIKEINFGDCLLKTKGAKFLADGLKYCLKLERLTLSSNEIGVDGAKELIKSLKEKDKLISVILDGNCFGNNGRNQVKALMKEIGKFNTLGSLSEDESSESEEEEEEDDDEEEEAEENSEKEEREEKPINKSSTIVSASDFLINPTVENFLALGDYPENVLIKEAEKNNQLFVEILISIIMKVASLNILKNKEVCERSASCCDELYKQLFLFAEGDKNYTAINNSLLVNLGLMKGEDKIKFTWNLDSCLKALQNALKKNYIPEDTKNTLKVFLQKDVDGNKDFTNIKKEILTQLH